MHPGVPIRMKPELVKSQLKPLQRQVLEGQLVANPKEGMQLMDRKGEWGQILPPKFSIDDPREGPQAGAAKTRRRNQKRAVPPGYKEKEEGGGSGNGGGMMWLVWENRQTWGQSGQSGQRQVRIFQACSKEEKDGAKGRPTA